MNFNDHSRLRGQHAFLSASKYHWINYDPDKLAESYVNYQVIQRGTELHDIACRLIENKIRLPRTKQTLNLYVNDAIGFQMIPEQVLYYSENCFGTTDAISFQNDILRIHDLKTGVTPGHMEQLMIYNALFCLEYHIKPTNIKKTELRIYQFDTIESLEPEPEDILEIMDKIEEFDPIITELKLGA